jgi:hypothetical protein
MTERNHRVLWLSVLIVLIAGAAHAAADPGGFAGLTWARSEADCRNQKLCSDQGITVPDAPAREKQYLGKLTELNRLPVKVSSFAFFENRFFMGTASFDAKRVSFDSLKAALVKLHGKPRSTGPRGAAWVLGNSRIVLYQGETYHGVAYAHLPTYTKMLKAKTPPPPAPANKPK